MDQLTWTPEKRLVADLKEFPNNPRKISPDALAKLKERITNRGFHDIVKVDTDGFILSGNQRKRALLDLGITEVWALIPSRALTREERDAVVLESNRNDGDWDFKILQDNFDIKVLADIGFSEKELGIFFPGTSGESGKLDETEVQTEVKCPNCGHSWAYKRTIKKASK